MIAHRGVSIAVLLALAGGLSFAQPLAGELVPLEAPPLTPRNYGPEQATGPPNTPRAADSSSAWASLTTDTQPEWLAVEFASPVRSKTLVVYENHAPGALVRVTVHGPDGKEVEAWRGTDPTPTDAGKGVSIVPLDVDGPIHRLTLHLDSPAVPGWNEIDAVGLVDADGKTHWAARAKASSYFGQTAHVAPVAVDPPPAAPVEGEPLQRLEAEVKSLREEIATLRKLLEERLPPTDKPPTPEPSPR